VRGVTDHYTLRREYPAEKFNARVEVFEYLLDHMEARSALAQLFSVFLRGTVDSHFMHVIRNPVVLSERAQADPQKLLDQIGRMSDADQQLLAPFVALVRSNAAKRLPAGNHQH